MQTAADTDPSWRLDGASLVADSATHCPATRLGQTSHQGLPSGVAMAATLSMALSRPWQQQQPEGGVERRTWSGTPAGCGRPHRQRLAGGGATFLSQRHLRPARPNLAHFPPVAKGTRTIVSAENPPVVSCSERAGPGPDWTGSTRCLSPRPSSASRDAIRGWRRGMGVWGPGSADRGPRVPGAVSRLTASTTSAPAVCRSYSTRSLQAAARLPLPRDNAIWT